MHKVVLRPYRSEDIEAIIDLFIDAVMHVKEYDEKQRTAWAGDREEKKGWDASFLEHKTLVAEMDGEIVGFADMDGDYLDRLYVAFDKQGKGIATALVDELEKGHDAVTVHASYTALPFFEKRGYVVEKKQTVVRHGVELFNFAMRKNLRVPGCD